MLPFDHRASFMKKMFGIEGRVPTPEEAEKICDTKMVIYEGFKKAVTTGAVPKEGAAILVDEQFGDAVLKDAKANGYDYALCTEKSGQDEYDFEYADEWREHLKKYQPKFVKSLVRYNPGDDAALNARQRERLKLLSEYCHQQESYFLIEPLIPATKEQLASVGGDQKRYDTEVRPYLAVQMVKELLLGGVEVDVWKIEGMEEKKHYEEFMLAARSDGREGVSAIVLGRGADNAQVETWLKAGAGVEGVVGFAIGRTIFWDGAKGFKDGTMTRQQAIDLISKNFEHFYQVFIEGMQA